MIGKLKIQKNSAMRAINSQLLTKLNNSYNSIYSLRKFCNNFSSSKAQYIASIDQSTTTTKFSLFQTDGELVDQQIIRHQQYSQKQGWLEHDPSEIVNAVQKSAKTVSERVQSKGINLKNILGLGICNQRETVVCWDDKGQPLCNAIVWSDSRTLDICKKFEKKHGQFKNLTGLPVSTYFSLFKILWILENKPQIKQKLKQGNVRFGTIDSWLTYNLTGQYVTDASNASRTHLCDIHKTQWNEKLLSIAKLKKQNLPRIIDSFTDIGKVKTGALQGVPVQCILGDQQSSAYAHQIDNQQMKITYGTGCFLLTNQGNKPSFDDSFVTTILSRQNNKNLYGFQASIQCGGGTINWANSLGLFNKYDELNDLPDTPQGLYCFPSFGSIYSPFWKSNVPGAFVGLTFNTSQQHLMQAMLQAITFRVYDNIRHKKLKKINKIIVDGGLSANKKFMQMQADCLGKQIQVRKLDTCWGVAKGVLVTRGQYVQQKHFESTNYLPQQENKQKYQKKYKSWFKARKNLYDKDL